MEDILASIRRIIAEDQSNSLGRSGLAGLTRRTPPTPTVEEPGPTPIFADAPAAQAVAEPEAHAAPQVDDRPQVFDASTEEAHGAVAVLEEEPVAALQPEPYANETVSMVEDGGFQALAPEPEPFPLDQNAETLMSPAAGASITSSFQALAENVMLQDPALVERILRESMRPLLKTWLDDHLPSIVERLVRTEIERVARGGRGRNT